MTLLLDAFVVVLWLVTPALGLLLVCLVIEQLFRLGRWFGAHRRGIRWSLVRGTRGDVVTPRPLLPDTDPIDYEEPVDAMVIRARRDAAGLRVVQCESCRKHGAFSSKDPDGLEHAMSQCSCCSFLCSAAVSPDCWHDHHIADHENHLQHSYERAVYPSL